MSQLSFFFKEEPDFSEENFIHSDANHLAYRFIDSWPNWGGQRLARIAILYGDEGCGKSHLASIWHQRTGAVYVNNAVPLMHAAEWEEPCYVIEDIDRKAIDEQLLFHAMNMVVEKGQYLLLTSRVPPAQLPFVLPDLCSRLNGVTSLSVAAPDEILVPILFSKLFSDRQLKVNEEIVQFLSSRVERSYAAITATVEQLDQMSLEEKRNITVPFVRHLLHMEECQAA